MAIQDAPDGTLWIQQVSVVLDVPTPPAPAHEYPISRVERYGGDDADYQEVDRWTVTDGRIGELKEISMVTDNFDETVWKLEIGGTVMWSAVKIMAPLTIPFFDLRLAAGKEVIIYCHSDGVTTIHADVSIAGKEIG